MRQCAYEPQSLENDLKKALQLAEASEERVLQSEDSRDEALIESEVG